jgi:NADPH-dependent glutamate synthase beta subunit-like oxidoreductase
VIGGAVAGATMAEALAKAGAKVVVFEQNHRPYGKIEDGLPRWHRALRHKEYAAIDAKLSHPNISVVPCTRIGEHIEFQSLMQSWGFSAVVLACGAWRDRPFPVEGAADYVGRGLLYQNPFIYWFNHFEESDYDGPAYSVVDDAVVVGGGLASIDVAKALTLETTVQALAKRGIRTDIETLEHAGIPKLLAQHGLSWPELGLRGATVYYRRRVQDMPLVEAPVDADETRLRKVEEARARIVAKATEKFCFQVAPLHQPVGFLGQEGQLVGLKFLRTRIDENGRAVPTDEAVERRTALVVSSVGSVPAPIPGLPMRGELFDFSDRTLGRFDGMPGVFSVGNAVTGKGNIVVSRRHSIEVATTLIESYLCLSDAQGSRADHSEAAAELAAAIEAEARAQPLTPTKLSALMARVHERQREVGYKDYPAWMSMHAPIDVDA